MTAQTPIDDALVSADDRFLTVIARLSQADAAALTNKSQAETVTALKDHAAQSQQALERVAGRLGGVTVVNSFWLANAVALEVDTDRVDLADIAAVGSVERLHANFELEAHADGGDGEASPAGSDDVGATNYTYGLDLINVPETWNTYGTKGGGVDVAVLDTGIDDTHPDLPTLSDEQWQEFDDSGNPVDSEPYDSGEHGTHVSGTVTGSDEPDGDVPAFGVAPGATLYHGLVIPAGGGSFTQVVAGMEWAVNQGVDVINMSLGAGGYNTEVIEPSENARNAGVLLVASAGNSGDGSTGSPGNVYPNFASGAVDAEKNVADFSSGGTIDTQSAWGDSASDYWPDQYVVPDVAAPGVNVLSSVPGGGYDSTFSGTSMSSPHQAGAAVLMLSAAGGGVSREQIIDALEQTASKPDDWDQPDDEPDTRYGLGVIDVEAATALVALDTGVEGVVELDGQPVESVSVEIGGSTVETDENGAFSRPLEPGEYDLTVSGFGIQEKTVSVTVEDGEEFTDIGVVTVDPAVDLSTSLDQPQSIEGGDDVPVTLDGANVDSLTVTATGDYDPANADLFVDGQSASFGDPVDLGGVDGEIPVTVGTTADTAGSLGLDHTAGGPGGTASVSTGPTDIFEELTIVGIVDATDTYGGDIAETLAAEVGNAYEFQQTTAASVVDTPGQYDAVVAQILAEDADVEGFVNAIETTDTGAVYLDQWGGDSNAIPQYAEVSDNLVSTEEGFDNGGPNYELLQEHPILDGFSAGDNVELHEAGFDDASWFTTAEGAPFSLLADVGGDSTFGEALAVDEATASVLASSLGRQSFADPSDFTADANKIFGQAVAYAATGGLDTGVTGVVEFEDDGTPAEGATVELGGLSVGTDENGAFSIYAEPGDYDLTVSGFGVEDTTVTVTVETGETLTDIGAVTVGPVVDLAVLDGQPSDIVSGNSVSVTVDAANVDSLTVAATGEYDPANADLFVDGGSAAFGDPVDLGGATGELGVTVETTANTEGTLGLDHTATGPGADVNASTGPTYILTEALPDVTYGLDQINADLAWQVHGTRGEGASVAVLDTGVDGTHPDLSVAKWQEFDENGDPVDSEPNDGDGHGTHVSGTVSGPVTPNGDVPAYGVAPDVDLYGGKVLDDSGGGSFAQIIAGIEWAVEEAADVINMSLGAAGYFPEMIEPLQNAETSGTLVVSSAGNSGDGSSGTPANVYGSSVAIGASNENRDIAGFSSGEVIDTDSAWGSDAPEDWPAEYVVPDVAAPGVDVLSSVPGGGYDSSFSGTSMASPHTAGSAAIVISAASALSPDGVRAALEDTAEKPSDWGEPDDERDTRYGLGIVDVNAATAQVALDTGVEGVVESNGEAVAGATVDISGGGATETAEDGSFSLPLEPGDYDLTVSGFGIQDKTVSVTVEDGEEFTDIGVIAADPAVEFELLVGQPGAIEGGDTIEVTVEGANVQTLTVTATGDYDPANADLFVDGGSAAFGDPVDLGGASGELTVTVETTPETAGSLGLDHTADGPGESVNASTGPTDIFEELNIVGVVDADGTYGGDIADTLAGELGSSFQVEQTTAGSVVETPEQFDAIVAQLLEESEDTLVQSFVDTTQSADVGVVYLDQWGSTSDAIPQYASVSENVASTDQDYGFDEGPSYSVFAEHPILDGFAQGEEVLIHEGSTEDASWFQGAAGGPFDVLATLTTTETEGTGLAVREATRTVLAASLGRSTYVEPGEVTDAANQILAQAVAYVASPVEDGELTIAGVEVDSTLQGGETTVTVSMAFAEEMTVQALWADWDVSVASDGGASGSEDRVASDSEFELVWDSLPSFTTPSLSVSLPDRYVGGEFELTVTASDGEETVEASDTFEITTE